MKKFFLYIALFYITTTICNEVEFVEATGQFNAQLLEQTILSFARNNCSFSQNQITAFNIPFIINNNPNSLINTTQFGNIIASNNLANTLATNVINNQFAQTTNSVNNNASNGAGLYCVAPTFAAQVGNDPQQVGKILVRSGTAITISISNVIIDFNDTVLQGSGGSVGISITSGVSNVIIRNGTISSMGFAGILINTGVVGPIFIQNMQLNSNATGILANSPANVYIQNCNANFSTNNGFSFNQASECFFNNCTSNNNNANGFNCLNSNSVNFVQCIAENNTTNGFNISGLIAGQFIGCTATINTGGFSLINGSIISQNNNFYNCFAAQNDGSGFILSSNQNNIVNSSALINAIGFQITGNNNILQSTFVNSNIGNGIQISGNYATIQDTEVNGNGAMGIQITGNNSSIINTIAKNNTTNGFQITGTGGEIEHSHAINNGFNGIVINGSNQSVLNCEVKQHLTTNAINGNGVLLTAQANGCSIRNNTAIGNFIGFNNQGVNNKFYSNFANNNTTNFLGVPNVAVSPTILTPINFTANIAE